MAALMQFMLFSYLWAHFQTEMGTLYRLPLEHLISLENTEQGTSKDVFSIQHLLSSPHRTSASVGIPESFLKSLNHFNFGSLPWWKIYGPEEVPPSCNFLAEAYRFIFKILSCLMMPCMEESKILRKLEFLKILEFRLFSGDSSFTFILNPL